MNTIFISYSRKDEEVADQLRNSLEKAGFPVWTDEKIKLGDNWDRAIDNAIKDASHFVLVVSPNSTTSEWVKYELALATRLGKKVIPVLIEGNNKSTILDSLSSKQTIDATKNYTQAVQDLTKALAEDKNPVLE